MDKDRLDIYDTRTRTWSTAELSEARVGIGAVIVGNKILFAGGARNFDYNIGWQDLSTRVDIYDAVTNTWITTELPGEQIFLWGFGVTATIGTRAYFYSHYGNVDNVIYVFDVASDTWSTITLNGPIRMVGAISTLDNKIFFAGGYNLDSSMYMNRVDIYNSGTNGWTVSALTEPRELVKAVSVNNKVMFAGGQNPVGNPKSIVDIYDKATQTWTVAQLSRSTVLAGAVSVGQKALSLMKQ